jgi:hypothetical protein
MKSNIHPPDVDTIVVDVNEDICDIFTVNSNVEEMSTEPTPEFEDTSTAANHSFPANASRNSETRRKKAEKARHFLSCWHWKKEKLNNWRRLCNRDRLFILRKTKTTTF